MRRGYEEKMIFLSVSNFLYQIFGFLNKKKNFYHSKYNCDEITTEYNPSKSFHLDEFKAVNRIKWAAGQNFMKQTGR